MESKNNWGIMRLDIGKGLSQLIGCKFSEQYVTEAVKRLAGMNNENVKYYVARNMNAKREG